jgi:hypothetical protein
MKVRNMPKETATRNAIAAILDDLLAGRIGKEAALSAIIKATMRPRALISVGLMSQHRR